METLETPSRSATHFWILLMGTDDTSLTATSLSFPSCGWKSVFPSTSTDAGDVRPAPRATSTTAVYMAALTTAEGARRENPTGNFSLWTHTCEHLPAQASDAFRPRVAPSRRTQPLAPPAPRRRGSRIPS